MSVRIQVILTEEELALFKQQARKKSKSLSSWIRDSAYQALEKEKQKDLTSPAALKKFFSDRKRKESGKEPDWDEQKKLILEGYHQRVSS